MSCGAGNTACTDNARQDREIKALTERVSLLESLYRSNPPPEPSESERLARVLGAAARNYAHVDNSGRWFCVYCRAACYAPDRSALESWIRHAPTCPVPEIQQLAQDYAIKTQEELRQ